MKLIVGLGNPGSQYLFTRHNAGRLLIEHIASSHRLKFLKKKSLKASLAGFTWGEEEVTLAYPEDYMNVSGPVVWGLLRHLKAKAPKDLLVVVDDVALALGRLRLRAKGSSGGHNGLKSIEEGLGTTEYARLRLGIAGGEDAGAPGDLPDLTDYVLSAFKKSEKKILNSLLERGLEACRLWVRGSIESAMNIVNRDPLKT